MHTSHFRNHCSAERQADLLMADPWSLATDTDDSVPMYAPKLVLGNIPSSLSVADINEIVLQEIPL